MKTAKLVKKMEGWRGDARLYKVTPRIDGAGYVIVSAAVTPDHGPETYIFKADKTGEITDWCELKGSFVGRLDHAAALGAAGFKIV